MSTGIVPVAVVTFESVTVAELAVVLELECSILESNRVLIVLQLDFVGVGDSRRA